MEQNTNSPAPTPADDEIDLLDLIGTMWRNRWWIIGITGIALLFAVGSVVYDNYNEAQAAEKLDNREPVVSYTAQAALVFSQPNTVELIAYQIQDRFFQEVMARYLASQQELLELPEEDIETLASEVKISSDTKSQQVIVSHENSDQDTALQVVTLVAERLIELLEDIDARRHDELAREFDNKVEEINRRLNELNAGLLEAGGDSGAARPIEEGILQQRTLYEAFADAYAAECMSKDLFVVQLTQEPRVFETAEIQSISVDSLSSAKVRAVVIVLAGLFLSVFFVFLLEAVRSIKADPERMKKLKGIR